MSRSHSPAWDTAMSTDPCKSWLLGEGRSQSTSLTFGFVLYKVRVTVISNLWKRITYRPLVGLLQWCSGKESTCNVADLGLTLGWEDPLEKGMATHSTILAWEIPQTEEVGGRQYMESQSWTCQSDKHTHWHMKSFKIIPPCFPLQSQC